MSKKIQKRKKKIEKIQMDSKKSVNNFKWKKDRLPDYLKKNYNFHFFLK